MGEYGYGPVCIHCTAMVAMVFFSWCSSTSTFPGTFTVNWNDWPGLASILNVCSGFECTCNSSATSLLTG